MVNSEWERSNRLLGSEQNDEDPVAIGFRRCAPRRGRGNEDAQETEAGNIIIKASFKGGFNFIGPVVSLPL